MNMNYTIQIMFTITVVCTMLSTIIKVTKKNDKKNYKFEGMIIGIIVGTISSYYILNALICAPIGMFLGIAIGKNMKRDS
ncbi:MAG: hypothetical protein ACRCVJ_17470 [Clostridium sp.]|uniref:hypothetical protein n=1 Tax=Clostridium sp. TaxID=1506 RepID=UPI003F2B508E